MPEAGQRHCPSQLEAEVATRDASLIHIRPVRPEDADGCWPFCARCQTRTAAR